MSQTVRIDWQYILSQVCISVWPSNYLYMKNTQNVGKPGCPRVCLFEWSSLAIVASGMGHHGWVPPTHRTAMTWTSRWCMCACAHVCIRDVFAIHDNDIWPRLIMIIIILYFIQIGHTDDFASTGTRLVLCNLVCRLGLVNYLTIP